MPKITLKCSIISLMLFAFNTWNTCFILTCLMNSSSCPFWKMWACSTGTWPCEDLSGFHKVDIPAFHSPNRAVGTACFRIKLLPLPPHFFYHFILWKKPFKNVTSLLVPLEQWVISIVSLVTDVREV